MVQVQVLMEFLSQQEKLDGSDFAKKIGVITENDNIVVDQNMTTNVEGLYSCGNSTGGLLQVAKAVYEGAEAGLSAVKYINRKVNIRDVP